MNVVHDQVSNMLFREGNNGIYEPFALNYNEESGNTLLIHKSKIFMEVVEYVYYVRRQQDKRSGKTRFLPLFPYQWAFIFKYVNAVLNEKSTKYLEAYARQSGKSEAIKLTLGFLLVFIPKYKDIKLERFNAVLGSYKKQSVKKLFDEVKPYIYKAVEFHNKKYTKDELLIDKFGYKKAIDNDGQLTIDKKFRDGNIIPYSQIFAITAGTAQDSLSSHIMMMDEAGMIDNGLFETSMSAFTTTTAGIQSYIGVPNQDASSLLFQKYLSKDVIKTVYNWKSVYELRLLVDKDMAENYRLDYESKIRTNGEKSAYVRWNYFLDFEDMNGKFITRKLLEDGRMLSERVRTPENNKDNWVLAGLDISPKSDFFSLTMGEMKFNDNDEEVKNITKMITFNKFGDREKGTDRASSVVKEMIKNKVDILCVDATSHQLYFIQLLYDEIKKQNCGTMLVPLPYNNNKQAMFGYLEDSLFGGNLKLLQEDECWESSKLVEEMLYLLKTKKKDSEGIDYGAPNQDGFTDDHVNSVALFNYAYRYCRECSSSKKKNIFDDGANTWRIRLRKNTNLHAVAKRKEKYDNTKLHFSDKPITFTNALPF